MGGRQWSSIALSMGILAVPVMSLSGCAVSGYHHLPDAQQDAARRVQKYFNDLSSLQANFAQEGPGRQQGDGHFTYVPGALRLDYDIPNKTVLIAKGDYLTLNDGNSGAVTRMSLKRNPMGFLLRHPLKFDDGVQVSNVMKGMDSLQISLTQADNPSQGLLTLQFSDIHSHLSLIGIQGVDGRGHHFGLSLYEVKENEPVSADIFTQPSE